MSISKTLLTATLVAWFAMAQQGHAQTSADPHHSRAGSADTQAAPADPQPSDPRPSDPQPDMMGMMPGMMNMKGGMMNAMGGGMGSMGMGPMGMAGMDMAMMGMGMTERVEGRIAFLRAELRIAEAQFKAWDEFAETMRANARRMKEAGGHAMTHGASVSQIVTRLEAQERLLAARLEGVRAMKAKLVPLLEVLSEEQRKTADELLGSHLGVSMHGMHGMMMKPRG